MSEREPVKWWDGRPVYRCRFCRYERVANLLAVVTHEADAHAETPARESPILGADGEPLLVEV